MRVLIQFISLYNKSLIYFEIWFFLVVHSNIISSNVLAIKWSKDWQNIYNSFSGKAFKKKVRDIALSYFNHICIRHTHIFMWQMTQLALSKKRCFSCWIKNQPVFPYSPISPSFTLFHCNRISKLARQMTSWMKTASPSFPCG